MRMVPAVVLLHRMLRPLDDVVAFPICMWGFVGNAGCGESDGELGARGIVIGVGMWVVRIARPGVGSPTGVSRRYACAAGLICIGRSRLLCGFVCDSSKGPFGELASYGLCMVLVVAVIAARLWSGGIRDKKLWRAERRIVFGLGRGRRAAA